MSTNSNIGYQRKDGKVRAVYCHWDGYPTGVGATLLKNHDSAREARRLVSLGDISILAGTDGTLAPRGYDSYCADTDNDGIVTYNRWRKEGTPQHGTLYDNELAYARDNKYGGTEYLYLYRVGYGWFVVQFPERGQEPVFVPLAGLLADEERAANF